MLFQLLILCCSVLAWKLCFSRNSASDPPELSGWYPVVGHGYKLLGDSVKMFNSFVAMSEECLQKGGVVTFQLGPRRVYGLADPQDCLKVMNSCLEKSELFKFARPILGDGLIIVDAKRWHASRKLLNPAFNQKVLDGFVEVFNAQARSLLEQFSAVVGKPFDQDALLRINSLETICATLFDVPVSEYGAYFRHYLPLLLSIISRVNERIQKFWLHSDLIYSLSPEKKALDADLDDFLLLSQMIIRNKLTEKKNQSNNSETGKPLKCIDVLVAACEERGGFTERRAREEVDNMVVAGHETISTTLALALALLGVRSQVQRRLHQEVTRVCGNSDKNIEKEDLAKLVYTEAVLKETLRLYPAALILPRYTDRDIKLKKYTIKANSDIFIMAHGAHRHGAWGADAARFRPERWLHGGASRDSKCYAAFGLGRRACIGKVYAMMSMKTTLAHVVRRYHVSRAGPELALSMHMVTRPHAGHFITLQERN